MSAARTRPAKSDADYLSEACHLVRGLAGRVWFKTDYTFDAVSRTYQPRYCIYRRGMGLLATRARPQALVAFLRRQRPVKGAAAMGPRTGAGMPPP
jgi:hypothetical protein